MAAHRAAAVLLCAAVFWICMNTSAAAALPAAAANTDKTSPLAKARLPGSLLGGANESQQKQLNPQLLANFLRPLATYLASLTAPAMALDNWDSVAQAQALPAAPSKLALLASLFGFGQPVAPAEGQNPSYAPGL